MAAIDINALYAAQDSDNNDSKKTVVYTADDGTTQYSTSLTENIAEALGFSDFTNASTATPMPRGFAMRKVTFADSSGRIRGSYPVGTPSTAIYVEGGTVTVARKGKATGVVCQVTGSQGERRTFAASNDTGQQSGDNT